VLEKIAQKGKPGVNIGKVDVQKNQQLAQNYGVRSIPDTRVFVNGEEFGRFVGSRDIIFVEELIVRGLSRLQTEPNLSSKEKAGNLPAGAEAAVPPIQRSQPNHPLPPGIKRVPAP
jgi:thioredoxin-like negative regulator of GroEL